MLALAAISIGQMRVLVIILTMMFAQRTVGQIVNSLSADKTGMYYYSLDSLTKRIKDIKKIERLVLRGDLGVINSFPDSINGLMILKDNGERKIKTKDINSTDIVIKVTGLSIIRDQVTIAMYTYEKVDKDLIFFADVAYIFYLKYLPDTQTYKLNKLKNGLRL
ncbi:MAG: hypothetical protein KF763_18935 [Cyclobacteriaceae bacterium]|nr:hypothetical protein [Cyclobacteriaceae bacterium]